MDNKSTSGMSDGPAVDVRMNSPEHVTMGNVSLLEHSHDVINSMFDSISEIIQVYAKSRSFLLLWFIAIAFFVLIFAFDVIFPVFSIIPATNGGMGWNAHYIGVFYVLYSSS